MKILNVNILMTSFFLPQTTDKIFLTHQNNLHDPTYKPHTAIKIVF